MKNIIVGTAGHIDHGKTSLVKALTGIDADRLAEEKRRGITIDLGFAHLRLAPDLRLGFIDVPGHERFVRNMLAGAGGIDLLLFVIAADESIKPQTREHFEICRLLGVRSGVVAITKADLVEPGLLDLVRAEIDEFTSGSFLDAAPKIAVSARTGSGLEELKHALLQSARAAVEKTSQGWFRLPVDRAFTMKGFGAVVTGTLISGSVRTEQEIELYPTGRRLRVRGVQVYGEAAALARAGERTALNLPGIDPGEIRRGMVLSEPGCFSPVQVIDCRLHLLPSAPAFKRNTPVHLHIGSAEIEATVRLHSPQYARIRLREPALVLPGDRFIIRRFSPVTTIGGGEVADISGRRLRSGDNIPARLHTLLNGSPQARVEQHVFESRDGISRARLQALTGFRELPSCPLIELAGEWLIARERAAEIRRDLARAVSDFHAANTLAPGIPKHTLHSRVLPNAPVPLFEHLLAATPEVVREGEIIRLPGHRITLKSDEERAKAAIETAFERAGLSVPSTAEVLQSSGVETGRARGVLRMLVQEGRLIAISGDLTLHRTAVVSLRAMFSERRGQRFSVPQFKEWTGVSRKYAIPLLEYLDRIHVTRREGDLRLVI